MSVCYECGQPAGMHAQILKNGYNVTLDYCKQHNPMMKSSKIQYEPIKSDTNPYNFQTDEERIKELEAFADERKQEFMKEDRQ